MTSDMIRDVALRVIHTQSYVRLTRGKYTIGDTEPDSPPYVAVTSDDDIDTIMKRLRRLVQTSPGRS